MSLLEGLFRRASTSQDDFEKRQAAGEKRRELEHELRHERPKNPATDNHAVHINGKKWKSFGSKTHATGVANKIAAKNAGKKVTVHKEEVEQITELKRSTLASYVRKASDKTALNLHMIGRVNGAHPNAEGRPDMSHLWKKINKRIKGSDTALNKLAKEEVIREVCEKLQSKRNPKGHGMSFTKGVKPADWGFADDPWPEKSDKKKKSVKESVDLAELKKSTLGNYINKASASVGRASRHIGHAESRMNSGVSSSHRKMFARTTDILSNIKDRRLKGIATATKKLTKESIDLAELMKALPSYVDKATNSMYKAQNTIRKQQILHAPVSPSDAKTYFKRKKGITTALRQMQKEAVFPKGPKTPMTPEIAAQVARDIAKRKKAKDKILMGVKKTVDSEIKSKKPIRIHDPLDEETDSEKMKRKANAHRDARSSAWERRRESWKKYKNDAVKNSKVAKPASEMKEAMLDTVAIALGTPAAVAYGIHKYNQYKTNKRVKAMADRADRAAALKSAANEKRRATAAKKRAAK